MAEDAGEEDSETARRRFRTMSFKDQERVCYVSECMCRVERNKKNNTVAGVDPPVWYVQISEYRGKNAGADSAAKIRNPPKNPPAGRTGPILIFPPAKKLSLIAGQSERNINAPRGRFSTLSIGTHENLSWRTAGAFVNSTLAARE